MEIDQPTACDIFVKEILKPLYFFLFMNVIIQMVAAYYYYCIIIMISAFVGVTFTIKEVRSVNAQIHEMSYYEVPLSVLREGKVEKISSLEVVPGDVVFMNQPVKLPFDGILLEGEMLIN